MIFSKCLELCNYHHNSILEHFHHSKMLSGAYFQLIPAHSCQPLSIFIMCLDKLTLQANKE